MDKGGELFGMKDDTFSHSLTGLRFAHLANGVSQLHGEVSKIMWSTYPGVCEIKAITNAQNWRYWADKHLYKAKEEANDVWFDDRKRHLKKINNAIEQTPINNNIFFLFATVKPEVYKLPKQ